MGTGVYLSSRNKMRGNKNKVEKGGLTIVAGTYVSGFIINLQLSNGKFKKVDFFLLFLKYVKGGNQKYFSPYLFKRFRIANGNIFWGINEDIIFTLDSILSLKNNKEEILYII